MKQYLHNILSISLALIVLLSSFSFTINRHICGGEIANTTLFISADNCNMDMQTCKTKTLKKQTSVNKEPCCKDVSELIQGNDNNQQVQEFQLNIPQIQFIAAFVSAFILKFKETTQVSTYVLYKPPSVYKNIQTLFQVFRI